MYSPFQPISSSVIYCPRITGRIQNYYLLVNEFIQDCITIPTTNLQPSSANTSLYFAGRATVYDTATNEIAGICSASFLCLNNGQNIFVDISNYLSLKNGLIVSWLTPSTPANLEIDSIVYSMVTECIVKASTKVGVNPYYGHDFNMIVSSEKGKITFQLTPI